MIAGTRPPAILDRASFAELLGVTPETVSRKVSESRHRTAAGLPLRPKDYPLPDGHVGGSPWWYRATVEAWQEGRPGKGAGAGRPRKSA
jgi:hypothetical protein